MYNYDYNTLTTSVPINITFGKELRKSSSPNLVINELLEKSSACGIYTDGSKSPKSKCCGSAVIHPNENLNIYKSIESSASVFTSECIALNDAINAALDIKNQNIIIFSDSLSVLQCFFKIRY